MVLSIPSKVSFLLNFYILEILPVGGGQYAYHRGNGCMEFIDQIAWVLSNDWQAGLGRVRNLLGGMSFLLTG